LKRYDIDHILVNKGDDFRSDSWMKDRLIQLNPAMVQFARCS